jgi:hypothetical protein
LHCCDRCKTKLETMTVIEYEHKFEFVKFPMSISLSKGMTGSSMPLSTEIINKQLCENCYQEIKAMVLNWLNVNGNNL